MGRYNLKGQADFDAVKERAEMLYASIDSVYCPYFQEKVAFNAKGIRHLKFKSDQQARPRADQYSRLKLLHLAPKVLGTSRTLQGIWRTRRFEAQKTNSRWERVLKEVTFYEIRSSDRFRPGEGDRQGGDGRREALLERYPLLGNR